MALFKKRLAIILAVCLVVMNTVPAFAANDIEPQTDTAEIETVLEDDVNAEVASPSEAEYEDAELKDDELIDDIVLEEDREELIGEDAEELIEEDAEFFGEAKVGNVIITAKAEAGVVPKGTVLWAKTVVDTEVKAAIDEVVEEKREDETQVLESLKFDIKLLKDGEEIEPNGKVSISFALADAAANADVNVYHIKEDEETEELIEAEVLEVEKVEKPEDETPLVIETEVPGFSYYVVEFTYNGLTYELPGGESVQLSEILAYVGIVGIAEEAKDKVSKVEISNTDLFSAEKNGDDWTVISHQSFTSEEWMKVVFDGFEYEIIVTDPGPTNWSLLKNAMAGEDQAGVPGAFTVRDSGTTRTILLGADMKAGQGDTTLEVTSAKNVVLRLDGHTLDGNGGDFCIISVDVGSTLTIMGPGAITGSDNEYSGGGILNAGTLTIIGNGLEIKNNKASCGAGIYNSGAISLMNGIEIKDNTASGCGGGIYTNKHIKLGTKDTITGCEATSGGAVYVAAGGFFESMGGKTEDCHATECGGGVYVENGGTAVFATEKDSSYNTPIKGCTAQYGGGIYSEGAIGVDNAVIENNTASEYGGGIYLGENGSIFLGRKATITGNTKDGNPNNLFLTANVLLTKFGTGEDVQAPASGMKIGVTAETVPTVGNPVQITSNGAEEYEGYVTSDNADYKVIFNSDHFELSAGLCVTFDTQGGSEILPQAVKNGEKALKPADPIKTDCEFAGWYTDEGCTVGKEYDFNTPVTANITLYAKWVVVPRATITGLTADKPVYKVGDTIKLTATIDGPDETKVFFVVSEEKYVLDSYKGEAVIEIPLPFTNPGDYTITASLLNGSYKIITITVKQGSTPDPKKKESSSGTYSLFTGTWNNPVSNGSWTLDANGVWHYTTNASFRSTWGYIVNPYATAGQNSADWFYFDAYGNMLTGWQLIGGKWYYLNPFQNGTGTLGACLIGPGKTPDGWTIDENGAWIGR